MPTMVSGIVQYKTGTLRLETALEQYSKPFEEYVSALSDIDALVDEIWDKHMHKIKPFYDQVRSDDDLVISASPQIVVDEVCRRLGIKRCIGTQFDRKTGKLGRVCFRENKIAAFREAYPDAHISALYTDSMHDKPLMDISDSVYFVKGNKIKRIK